MNILVSKAVVSRLVIVKSKFVGQVASVSLEETFESRNVYTSAVAPTVYVYDGFAVSVVGSIVSVARAHGSCISI